MMQQGLFTAERNSRPEKIDVAYLLLMVLMTGLGFVALYTGSMAYAERLFDDQLYFVRRQGLTLAVGIVASILCATVRLSFIRKSSPIRSPHPYSLASAVYSRNRCHKNGASAGYILPRLPSNPPSS